MSQLHNERVIWVTGAASGIGQAAVEEIVAEGGRVIASDLPGTDFSWVEDIEEVFVVTGDVSDPDHNEAAVQAAQDEFGRIDGAVLNAGVSISLMVL